MICDKCKGRGYYENPHIYHVSGVEAYERGYTLEVKCRKCGGSGFLLGNAKEVMDALDVAIKTKTPFTIRELKQLKLILQR